MELAANGNGPGVLVFELQESSHVDVTDRTVLSVDDPSVAFLGEQQLIGVASGTTKLRATIGTTTITANVLVKPVDEAPLSDFWFVPQEPIAVHELAPFTVACEGRLTTGDVVSLGDRLAWESLDPEVCKAMSGGILQPVADGHTFVLARDPATDTTRSLEVFIALPRASGALLDHAGGYLTAASVAAWVPPLALGARDVVSVSELDEGALPGPLSSGASLLGAVRLDAPQHSVFQRGVQMSLTIPAQRRGGAPELAQVLVWNPLQGRWQHFAWITRGNLGSLQWITWFPSIFAIVESSLTASSLAEQHAPTLDISRNDLAPISLDFLLEHCDLRRDVVAGLDPLVDATPDPASLRAHDSDRHYLALDDDMDEELDTGSGWGTATLGGLRRPLTRQPTVYWSLHAPELEHPGLLVGARHFIAIQYWLLYAASSLPGTGYRVYHQGDVEFVQVILDAQKDPPEPIAATASQHFYGEGRHWRDGETDQGRARVYVAQGSHATYFQRGFAGTGDRHGTTTSGTGFTAKVLSTWPDWPESILYSEDVCASPGDEGLLRPVTDYALIGLDGGSETATMLRDWHGTIDRGYLNKQVPMVRYRAPDGPAGLDLYGHPLGFHLAYDFSTENSILAYLSTGVTLGDREARLRIGQRMFDLQEFTAGREPGGLVQEQIDQACIDQPVHLSRFLLGQDASYRPPSYFACDEWRLLRVTPQAPLTAGVGGKLRLTVSWSGLSRSTIGAVTFPLRLTLLPAVDEGYFGLQGGSYPGPSGPRPFVVRTNAPLTVSAVAGTISADLELEWAYLENFIPVPIPPQACQAAEPEMQWRFHLFVLDAANTTLYHTNSIVIGPFEFLRDGPPIEVTTLICQAGPAQ